MKIVTVNPATGQRLRDYDAMERTDVEAAVLQARLASEDWRVAKPNVRGKILRRVAEILRTRNRELASTISEEMGKIIRESRGEVEKAAGAFEFYADHADEFLKPEKSQTDANVSYVAFEPLGVIASIMPWNSPMWLTVRSAAPALAGGNTMVYKPSSVTPEIGLRLQAALTDAGLPRGCFTTMIGDYKLGEALVEAQTDAVTFTGSVEAGIRVAELAAKHVKKTVLELGGSDPFIVLDDANIDAASTAAVTGRFLACGQNCVAAKRFLVHRAVAKEFIDEFVEKTEKLRVGDPMSEQTDLGPLVREDAVRWIERQVNESVAQGASVVTGGKRLEGNGFFYKPTILIDVRTTMPVMAEETFGPVAPIMEVADEGQALAIANASEFGLGASIWTRSLQRGEDLAKRVRAGVVTVNNVVVSDPRVPFGGIKKSGIGRELSRYGMLEFMNIKTVRIHE